MSTPLVHLLLLKAFGSNHTHVYAWPSRFFPHFCLFFKCVHLSKVMLQSVLCLEYHWSTHKKQVKMLCVELDCENKTSAAQCFYLTSISVLIKHNYQKKRIKSWSTFLFNCFYFFFLICIFKSLCNTSKFISILAVCTKNDEENSLWQKTKCFPSWTFTLIFSSPFKILIQGTEELCCVTWTLCWTFFIGCIAEIFLHIHGGVFFFKFPSMYQLPVDHTSIYSTVQKCF